MTDESQFVTSAADLAQMKQQIVAAAAREVEAIMLKYSCQLAAVVMVTPDGRLTAQIHIVLQ